MCVPSKKQGFSLWQIQLTFWIQLNPLFAKSFICRLKQPQSHIAVILYFERGFPPVNFSVTLVRRWHHHGKNNHHVRESHMSHTSHPLPSRNLFPCAGKLVHFHAVSVVSASLTLFLYLCLPTCWQLWPLAPSQFSQG